MKKDLNGFLIGVGMTLYFLLILALAGMLPPILSAQETPTTPGAPKVLASTQPNPGDVTVVWHGIRVEATGVQVAVTVDPVTGEWVVKVSPRPVGVGVGVVVGTLPVGTLPK